MDTKTFLKILSSDGTFTSEDALELVCAMKREKILSKYKFPKKVSSDGYYHLNVTDPSKKNGRRQIKAKTLEKLKGKVYTLEMDKANFRKIFEIVMDEKMRLVKGEDKTVSRQNSVDRYWDDFNRFILDTDFETMNIDEITKEDIERILEYNCTRFDLKPKAFAGLRTIICMPFRHAFREGLIVSDPTLRVDFGKYKDMLLDRGSIDDRVHTEKEVENIIQELHKKQQERPKYVVPFALELQILMGQRRGEVPPLMWSDICSDAPVPYITIRREQLTAKKTETEKEHFVIADYTKTHRPRRFPITPEIQDLLNRLLKTHKSYHIDSPYLFPADTETGVITNNAVYNLYRRICKKLNIKISRDCIKGPHSFRRNGITNFVNNGGDLVTASRLYGNSPQTANAHYYTGVNLTKVLEFLA